MSFLPDGYVEKEPIGNYLKLVEGDNTIRCLSDAIVGWEIWRDKVVDGKKIRIPYRFHEDADIPMEYQDLETESNRFKKFWAFVVYSRENKKIQILEITQAGVRKAINNLIGNKKWGDPKEYDIVITRTKTGAQLMDVEYGVTPDPKKPMEQEIIAKYESMEIDLHALYKGEDPFAKSKEEVLPPTDDDIPGK